MLHMEAFLQLSQVRRLGSEPQALAAKALISKP